MIYLDNAANTFVSHAAGKAVLDEMAHVGNPSSIHFKGEEARRRLENVEENILQCIGCHTGRIYFTSGGTESNNLALNLLADYGRKTKKNHFITTTFEHSSVFYTMRNLENHGFEVTYIKPNSDGLISADDIESAIRDSTIAVSMMFVNNEIGTIQPVKRVGEICAQHKIYFHCDAVQAIGHIPIDMDKNKITFLSASAHKFGGISGSGFLAQNNSFNTKDTKPLLFGGKQNYGIRPGTENMVGIMAMNAALSSATNPKNINWRKSCDEEMFVHFTSLLKSIPNTRFNGTLDLNHRLPSNINVSFKNVNSENLIYLLSSDKIYVSASSACEAKGGNPNYVLTSIGVDEDFIGGTLRITTSDYTTIEDMDKAFKSIKRWVETLRAENT